MIIEKIQKFVSFLTKIHFSLLILNFKKESSINSDYSDEEDEDDDDENSLVEQIIREIDTSNFPKGKIKNI